MKRSKLLSLILTICLVLSMLSDFATVNAVSKPEANSDSVFELPDIIDSAEAEEHNYIGRAQAEENDLYTFVFANGNGTNTMRVFSHPVKYVDEDGTIRDIALDIKAKSGGGFVSAAHEIITTFQRKLTEGISLEYQDLEIMLVPSIGQGATPVAQLSSDGKTVTYEVNDVTSFVYELTYAGFKEDIVVEEYTGQTEYTFTLFTNGLTLCEEYGSWYLADAQGNVEATIGDIIVFTADERNNTMGSITCETVRANQEYTLTIHLDADYLADEDTVYPIRIDPTVEINYDQNGAGAIEDVTIKQNSTFSGTSGALYIGRSTGGDLYRALMRFPNLVMDGIAADQITSATVELRDLMCQGDEDITIDCHIYNTGSPSWSESGTTTWSSVGTAYVGTLLDSHVISYGKGNVESHRYAFNILAAAKAWVNGTQSPAKGLVFKANSTFESQTGDAVKTWHKTFASYNRSAYRPSLTIAYQDVSGTEYYIAFQTDGNLLTSNPSYLLSRTAYAGDNSYQKWIFSAVDTGVYIIRMKENINKCLTAIPSNATITLSDVSAGNTNQYWKIDVSSGGIYLQSNSSNSNIKGKKLYSNGSSLTLNSTLCSKIVLIECSQFVPCTSMSLPDIHMNAGTDCTVDPTFYPSNVNYTSGWVLSYTSSSTDVFTISDGTITATDAGTATLTIRNKVTGVSCTANLYVTRLPNSNAQNKDSWCWAACSKMVGEHNGGTGALDIGVSLLTYSDGLRTYNGTKFYGQTYSLQNTCDSGQRQIVINIFGDDHNNAGNAYQIEQALQLASKNNMTVGTLGSNTIFGLTASNINTMKDELANGRWVVGNAVSASGREHAIVIQSFDASTNRYIFWNPWTDRVDTFSTYQLENDSIEIPSDDNETTEYWQLRCFQYCR